MIPIRFLNPLTPVIAEEPQVPRPTVDEKKGSNLEPNVVLE
jgi:hypothetical protein